ncbi:uncharacterized protein [Aegilops tauschii subsp. strangulata]|uniref:uncharacterized protein n=1 Tax=Aegilops tauschii subsp. strangulata TaxID=200361 RepID=UPI003CC8D395
MDLAKKFPSFAGAMAVRCGRAPSRLPTLSLFLEMRCLHTIWCVLMLLDVVSVYNMVTDLTDKKQAVKISIDKVQAFREYYPSSNDPSTILECVWVKDKFVLHEKTKASSQKTQDEDLKSCTPDSSIQYETPGLVSEGWDTLPYMVHDI